MLIHSRTVFDMVAGLERGDWTPIEDDTSEYSGPIALCDRGESHKVTAAALSNSSADQARAGEAFGKSTEAIGKYGKFLTDTYGKGGEFETDAKTLADTASSAGNAKVANALNRNAQVTNENTASYAPVMAENERQNARDVTSFEAAKDAERLGNLNAGEARIPSWYEALYGPSISGADSSLSTAEGSAKTPSTWDTISGQVIDAGGAVASGFGCWIAEAIWGVNDQRTHLVRVWLNMEFKKGFIGSWVMRFYLRYGRKLAVRVKRGKFVAWTLRPVFNLALRRAGRWLC